MSDRPKSSPHERVNQKDRTRAAIVAAAIVLADKGEVPTVSDAADEARVGRTTAYRYFPSQDRLLFEAILDTVPTDIDNALGAADAPDEPEDRVKVVIETLNSRVRSHEAAFRTLLRLSLERARPPRTNEDPRSVRLLGGRRVSWLDEALGPARKRIDDDAYDRLLAALTLCVGVEPYVVLRDACGLTGDESDAIIHWIAETLVEATLRGSDPPPPRSHARKLQRPRDRKAKRPA